MWNKNLYILILLFISIIACKKQSVEYDREKELPRDTLTFISGYSYTIPTANPGQANIRMGFVTFNQLQSKTNYSNDNFIAQDNSSSYVFSIQNDVVLTPVKLNNYSTICLFETGNESWYNDVHNVGFYLRRFLENTNNNVAIGYYQTDNTNSQVIYVNDNDNSIFNNHWEDNLKGFYEATGKFNGYNFSLANVIDKIDQTITVFSNSYSALPNKSITTFLPDFYSYSQSDTLLITNLINRAITEGIELNFIANSDDYSLKEIAYKTGGVFINNIFTNYSTNILNKKQITYVGIAIENLEQILLKDYTYHQYDFSIVDSAQSAFNPGITNYFKAEYNGVKFQYVIKS